MRAGMAHLSESEITVLEILCAKMEGEVDKDVDILELIVQKHQAGELSTAADDVLELAPVVGDEVDEAGN